MFNRLILLIVVTVAAIGCGQQKEVFPTAGAPGSTTKSDSPAAKGMDAAKQAGRLNARPGRN